MSSPRSRYVLRLPGTETSYALERDRECGAKAMRAPRRGSTSRNTCEGCRRCPSSLLPGRLREVDGRRGDGASCQKGERPSSTHTRSEDGMGEKSIRALPANRHLVRGVKRLIDFGFRRSEAARAVGVDWKSADKIARGLHPKQQDDVNYVRCKSCGGMVQLPCRLCDVRMRIERRAVFSTDSRLRRPGSRATRMPLAGQKLLP